MRVTPGPSQTAAKSRVWTTPKSRMRDGEQKPSEIKEVRREQMKEQTTLWVSDGAMLGLCIMYEGRTSRD